MHEARRPLSDDGSQVVEVAVEILFGLLGVVAIVGLIFKWVRGNARRDQQALASLRDLIEDKQREFDYGKAS